MPKSFPAGTPFLKKKKFSKKARGNGPEAAFPRVFSFPAKRSFVRSKPDEREAVLAVERFPAARGELVA